MNVLSGLVINIEEIQSQGLLAPLTPSGTIVIDGIVTSNYAVVHSHSVAHYAMQPYKWWRSLVGSPQLNRSEIHTYATFLYDFATITGFIEVFK